MNVTKEDIQEIRLPDNWKLPKEWADAALLIRKEWTMETVKKTANSFYNYHHLKKSTRPDLEKWKISWIIWVRNQRTIQPKKKNNHADSFSKKCFVDGCGQEGVISKGTNGKAWVCRNHYY